jgi:hypothetical protein
MEGKEIAMTFPQDTHKHIHAAHGTRAPLTAAVKLGPIRGTELRKISLGSLNELAAHAIALNVCRKET